MAPSGPALPAAHHEGSGPQHVVGPESISGDHVSERCPWCGSAISKAVFLEIQERIREEERLKLAQVTADIEVQFAARLETARKQTQEESDKRHQDELKKTREVLAKNHDSALLKKEAEFSRERQSYQKKLEEFKRKLEQKTSNEIGDGAEIDLYETLRSEFPKDRITKIGKGQPGGDLLLEVLHKGEVCGRILLDAKNRQIWHDTFLTKLRADQIAAPADHAILSTLAFPVGKKEMFVDDGIIVASPARVVSIVYLLRSSLLKVHTLGLSMKERAGKMTRLYKFMMSDEYQRLLREIDKLASDIADEDVKEQEDHRRVWKRRGSLTTRMKNLVLQIETEVSDILETSTNES